MNIEIIRDYCMQKSRVEECFPFDNDTLVFKVCGKMFLLISLKESNRMNVKCEPELALELRERHPEVTPGFHMNKKMWNTVFIDGQLSDGDIIQMIDHSYQEVIRSLPKKIQSELKTKDS